MKLGTASDLARMQMLQRQAFTTRARLDTAAVELTTGQKASRYEATGGNLTRLFALERALDRNTVFADTLALSETRLDIMQEAFGRVLGPVEDLAIDLNAAVGLGDLAAGPRPRGDGAARLHRRGRRAQHPGRGAGAVLGDRHRPRRRSRPADAILADLDALAAGAATAADAIAAIEDYFSPARRVLRHRLRRVDHRPRRGRDRRRRAARLRACAPTPTRWSRCCAPRRSPRWSTAAPSPATPRRSSSCSAPRASACSRRARTCSRCAPRVGVSQNTVERARAERTSERDALDLARARMIATDELEAASTYQTLQVQLESIYTVTVAARDAALHQLHALGPRCAVPSPRSSPPCSCSGSAAVAGPASAAPARIKDIVDIDGVRGNDLLGYGLVVGLNNSGDSLRNSPFTEDAIVNILERLGVNVTGEQIRARNVAAVLVTAALPRLRPGRQPDRRHRLGDRRRELADGRHAGDDPAQRRRRPDLRGRPGLDHRRRHRRRGRSRPSVTQGVPTSGTIPSGARVEREVGFDFSQTAEMRLALRNPDFTTAARIESAINREVGQRIARVLDAGTVRLDLAGFGIDRPALLVAQIENIEVQTATRARVVVDQRSGTIILGEDVRISRVAVTQGSITLRVEEEPLVVQPNPFADGQTVVIPRTNAEIDEDPGTGLALVETSVSLPEVIAGLNALGVSANDMIDILKSIKAAGALHAEFIVQ